jgi:hypothetical protein
MVSDRLIIRKSWHRYNWEYRADALRIQAHRATYRQLGLLILAVLFHEEPVQVRLDLTHPSSEIQHLLVEFAYCQEHYSDYCTRPYLFRYSPQETQRHPWFYTLGGVRVEDLPSFMLTNLAAEYSEEAWSRRDTVRGFGLDRATVRIAELLLNASRPENDVLEYELEDEGGFRGVGVHSAEVRLFLPGSLGWDGIL